MTTWKIDSPQQLSFDQARRLRVSTVSGSVNVVGSDDRPRLEVADVRGRPLLVRHEDGGLHVGYEKPSLTWSGVLAWARHRPFRWHADVTIAVPWDCPVELHVVSAQVAVSGVRERVRVRGVNSQVTLAGLPGDVDAQTVSGAIEAEGIAGDLRVRTVSGDLTVIEGSGGAVDAKTVSGSVTLDLGSPGPSDVRLASTSGDLLIRLPHRPDLQVQLTSTSGKIASAFPEVWHNDMPGARSAQGTLGGGKGRLWATSTSGQITLLRREPDEAGEGGPAGPGPGDGGAR